MPSDRSKQSDVTTICYVLAYRNPGYVRTISLLNALRADRYNVIEVINTHTGPRRYLEVLRRLAIVRRRSRPDIYVLGFRGHEIFWPVRAMTLGRPLVFDCLVSPSESMVSEGKLGALGRVAGRVLRPIERLMMHASSAVLTDTEDHRQLLTQRFALPPSKVLPVPIGAIAPENVVRAPSTDFRLLFYATMIPLHGIDVVRRAINALDQDRVTWRIIGGSADIVPPGVDHSPWVDLSSIISTEIPTASLGLGGPFGNTEQARRVVTGKTVQFLANGLPTLVANSPAYHAAGFKDRVNCVMCEPGEAQSIVDAIRWASANPSKLESIGRQGHDLYEQNFSDRAIADALAPALRQT